METAGNVILNSLRLDTERQLMDAGFIQDRNGQFIYTDDSGLKIIVYKVDGWEMDITLPNGVTIGLDASALTINNKAEAI